MIELFSHGSPNGHKISIALEELGLPYAVRQVNVFAGEGQNSDFKALNPNAKVPVIRDTEADQVITESNAILAYLAKKAGRLMPAETPESGDASSYWEAVELLMFQASTVGPMFGQRAYFTIMAPEAIDHAMQRYLDEGERINALVDQKLEGRTWFLGDAFSIVDIAFFGWYFTADHMGFSVDSYPNLKAWFARCLERPAVRKGVAVPSGLPELPPRKDLAA